MSSYKNSANNGKEYGSLYNWYAVAHPSGLAPLGWHIPTDKEWIQLIEYLGIDDYIPKMKSTCFWLDESNGSNISGFSGLPSGSCDLNGKFSGLGREGLWWSATEYSDWAWVFSFEEKAVQLHLRPPKL